MSGTTYPLATLACSITSAGISTPSLLEILTSLQASYQGIYGSDVTFDPSSQDAQWLAIQAQAQYDSNMVAIAVYNAYSPSTAQGANLSSVVKINGLKRLVPSYSTAAVTVGGQVGTQLVSCQVGDDQNLGTVWQLPALVTIPSSGSITVTATCTTIGAVAAAANTLTQFVTPTAGWQTVTNPEAATVGDPTESDAALRSRQAVSTALPAQTVAESIAANLAQLANVTSVTYVDNDQGVATSDGVPAHSLALVVAGGDVQDIVNVIGLKKSPGAQTYGNTSGTFTDAAGVARTINYSVPTQETVLVSLNLTPLTGYSDAVGAEIQASVAAYVNSLGVGTGLRLSRLYPAALLRWSGYAPASTNDPNTFEISPNGVLIALSPGTPVSADIAAAYAQELVCATSDVTLIVA